MRTTCYSCASSFSKKELLFERPPQVNQGMRYFRQVCMRIEDCELGDNLVAITAPFTRTEPEEDWVKARDAGIIPAAVFSLYMRAGFLSFGSSPAFFSDANQYL